MKHQAFSSAEGIHTQTLLAFFMFHSIVACFTVTQCLTYFNPCTIFPSKEEGECFKNMNLSYADPLKGNSQGSFREEIYLHLSCYRLQYKAVLNPVLTKIVLISFVLLFLIHLKAIITRNKTLKTIARVTSVIIFLICIPAENDACKSNQE